MEWRKINLPISSLEFNYQHDAALHEFEWRSQQRSSFVDDLITQMSRSQQRQPRPFSNLPAHRLSSWPPCSIFAIVFGFVELLDSCNDLNLFQLNAWKWLCVSDLMKDRCFEWWKWIFLALDLVSGCSNRMSTKWMAECVYQRALVSLWLPLLMTNIL